MRLLRECEDENNKGKENGTRGLKENGKEETNMRMRMTRTTRRKTL